MIRKRLRAEDHRSAERQEQMLREMSLRRAYRPSATNVLHAVRVYPQFDDRQTVSARLTMN